MATCISATRCRSASISVLPKKQAVGRFCVSMTRIQAKKAKNMCVRSSEMYTGWLRLGRSSDPCIDYFDQLYAFAEQLIEKGLAYVDSLSAEEIREYRGTLTEPGKNSPYRDRSVEESLDLFRRMRAGEFADGEHLLRAKIDMASPNINLRDPALYRIRHIEHQHTGDKWCIYPMYDFAHTMSDALGGTSRIRYVHSSLKIIVLCITGSSTSYEPEHRRVRSSFRA